MRTFAMITFGTCLILAGCATNGQRNTYGVATTPYSVHFIEDAPPQPVRYTKANDPRAPYPVQKKKVVPFEDPCDPNYHGFGPYQCGQSAR